jgi:hypothetical protein
MIWGVLSSLLWVLLVIGIVTRIARRRRAGGWSISVPLDEVLGQSFLLLALGCLAVSLLGFNDDLGQPITARTVAVLVAVTALALAYAVDAVGPLVVGVTVLTGWWAAEAERVARAGRVRTSVVLAGVGLVALLLVTLARLHARREAFAGAYLLLGLLGVVGLTMFLSTKAGLAELQRMSAGDVPLAAVPLGASLIGLAVALAVAVAAGVRRGTVTGIEAIAVVAMGVVFVALALVPRQQVFAARDDLAAPGIAWAVLFNALLFGEAVGVLLVGYARRQEALVNVGALVLFAVVVVKYFDWFFAFLDKSLFFVGAGLVLFAVGWLLERGRRRMIATLKEGTA